MIGKLSVAGQRLIVCNTRSLSYHRWKSGRGVNHSEFELGRTQQPHVAWAASKNVNPPVPFCFTYYSSTFPI